MLTTTSLQDAPTSFDPRAVERAEKSLQRMLEWIGRHDVRTAATLGITVAMVGALASATPAASRWTLPFGVALAAAGLGFLVTIGFLLRGILPRIVPAAPSPFFFGSIAGMDWSTYRRACLAMSDDDYLNDLLRQTHVNAVILRAKFKAFSRAVVALVLTALPWACAMALGKSLL